jgi:cytochrome c biogenesis protein CcmG/thiol:disulfide interchange protein DsbE
MKYNFFIILIIFIFIIFFIGLKKNNNQLNSKFINQPFPEIDLVVFNKNTKLTNKNFKNEIILVNFFASWCVPCIAEHNFLLDLQKQKKIKIYGINYKDNPINLKKWLEKLGNPYFLIGIDDSGFAGIEWGLSGVPESFLIDKTGIIRYKVAGPIIDKKQIEILIAKIEELKK